MYASFDDVLKRYDLITLHNLCGFHTDYDNQIDQDAIKSKVETALKDASVEINLFVGQCYYLPLSIIPSELIEACIDLAMFRLPQGAAEASDSIKSKADFWRQSLKKLAEGRFKLDGLDDQLKPEDTSKSEILIAEGISYFNDQSMKRF